MLPRELVAFLAEEGRFHDLRPSMKAAVDKVMEANINRMVYNAGPHPDISAECREFREKLPRGLHGPEQDLDLYEEVMRPLFHLLVARGA